MLTVVGALILVVLLLLGASRMGLIFPRFGRWMGRKLGAKEKC
jgi:hypothetical protein